MTNNGGDDGRKEIMKQLTIEMEPDEMIALGKVKFFTKGNGSYTVPNPHNYMPAWLWCYNHAKRANGIVKALKDGKIAVFREVE